MQGIKWDGHSHTEFCPHGRVVHTSKMIEAAIDQGFTHYSLTEHAPFPEGVYSAGDRHIYASCALKTEQVGDYLEHTAELKRHYANRIQILVGLEFEYLPGHQSITKDILDSYGPALDDSLLSLHMLPVSDGLSQLDYSLEHFEQGILAHYGGIFAVHMAYWSAVQEMVMAPLGAYKPKRIGHINLIEKYGSAHRLSAEHSRQRDQLLCAQIFPSIAKQELMLDYNTAGRFQPLCNYEYLSPLMKRCCREQGIALVYGSDAHHPQEVGRAYEGYAGFLQSTAAALGAPIPADLQP